MDEKQQRFAALGVAGFGLAAVAGFAWLVGGRRSGSFGLAPARGQLPPDLSKSTLLYEGPSQLDGKPIIAVATGLKQSSKNSKTGAMVQIYILKQDEHPNEAVKSGSDSSICGLCKHRGVGGKARTCYVDVSKAPVSIWRAWKRGSYPQVGQAHALARIQRAVEDGAIVRMGAYGDPAAVPGDIWERLTAMAGRRKWTGYTHQWKDPRFQHLRQYVQASVDTAQEREEAKAMGWRTFRVRKIDEEIGMSEIACPASIEAGHRTTCSKCTLCSGSSCSAKDIVIFDHSPGNIRWVKALNVLRGAGRRFARRRHQLARRA